MSEEGLAPPQRELMDGIYRHQRFVYDLTRKYYLLGRDLLIDELDVPDGGTVLELGCGTGRNLILSARRYPEARLFGLDLSGEMLKTASGNIERAGLAGRIRLARGDASAFDAPALFGETGFDRVVLSYALSMIPPWQEALAAGVAAIRPGGSLHVVDFGGQEGLPDWFGALLRAWLAKFHVTPRGGLETAMAGLARDHGADVRREAHVEAEDGRHGHDLAGAARAGVPGAAAL
ncbi:MAG: class I SAM-dependent methyltransferase, partial [Pseudomonadota bacterium]|nr:class I SAM-dependent methyltransferase [Pseudomonadota bacterium]